MHNDNRTHNVSVSLNEEEYEKYIALQMKSGLGKTAFARQALTEANVISPLSDEDKILIRRLSGMSRDLNRLLGAVIKENLEKHIKWLGLIEHQFDELYNEIREKANLK